MWPDGPLGTALTLCLLVITGTWLLSVITREYSWVDRLWSVVPPVYVGIFASAAGWSDARLNLMTALTTAWALRLTFNFWRKGGYARGGEDYRWEVLRERLGPVGFQVFNATFISPYQNVLLLLIALPAWVAWQHAGTPLGPLDAAAAALFVALLVGETVADQQQWDFHQRKHAAAARGEAVDPPFCTEGLWRYARHPNFFCEQSQWWALYLFGPAAGAAWLNPSLVGPVLLTLLFWGSTRFTEELSAAKYPAYARYQATTSMWLPLPPREGAPTAREGRGRA